MWKFILKHLPYHKEMLPIERMRQIEIAISTNFSLPLHDKKSIEYYKRASIFTYPKALEVLMSYDKNKRHTDELALVSNLSITYGLTEEEVIQRIIEVRRLHKSGYNP